MRDVCVNILSHSVLTIPDRDEHKLDREGAHLMVADTLIHRNIDPRDPAREWTSPRAQLLDFIAHGHDAVWLVIVRCFDAKSDADAALACARHDPMNDERLVARLRETVDAYVWEMRCSLNLADIEIVEGVIVDVIATPANEVVFEHHNLAFVDYAGLCDEGGDWSQL